MVVNARSLKRMKRRVTAGLHDFTSFPSSDAALLPGGTFRSNVREFLSRHALLPPPCSLFPHLMTWQVLFRVGDLTDGMTVDGSPVVVGLDLVEEDVSRSRSVYCDQCRVVGWSGHPVCTKRYHFIVKGDGTSIGGQVKPCTRCGIHVHLSEPRCKACSHVMTSEDLEDWMYQQLEDTTHLLHGVIHENGYGHLLRINGIEGGSKILSGFHIMDFWDRLCNYLGVRKISVMDVSKKYGLEYRLLHAITIGHPWYGDWGYEFGAGSFGLTPESYLEAVNTLSSVPLSTFIGQGRKPRSRVQELILFYQSQAEQELFSVKDLFIYLTSLVHNGPKRSAIDDQSFKKHKSSASGVLTNWSSGDLKCVEDAMIRVLKAVTWSNWVNWRTLKGAVCKVGPPDLLDHCLKNLGGKQAGDGIFVNTRCSPQSSALEFRLESGIGPRGNGELACVDSFSSNSPSKDRVVHDLRYLYESILHPLTMVTFGPESKRELLIQAATTLLDCKQFVKDYKPQAKLSMTDPTSIYVFCQPELIDQSEEDEIIIPPPELVILPQNATVFDLKQEVSKLFQEVYIMFKGFLVEELVDYGDIDDSTPVKLLVRSFETVTVRGRCSVKNGLDKFKMERGIERWTVDCACGAQDDDGERMLACDVCGVWQHTRCAGIRDSDCVPAQFVCGGCKSLFDVAKYSDMAVDARVGGSGGKSLPRCFLQQADFCA
ncbi:hypothetical protein V2J09_023635 [Rumex salicifolius]